MSSLRSYRGEAQRQTKRQPANRPWDGLTDRTTYDVVRETEFLSLGFP